MTELPGHVPKLHPGRQQLRGERVPQVLGVHVTDARSPDERSPLLPAPALEVGVAAETGEDRVVSPRAVPLAVQPEERLPQPPREGDAALATRLGKPLVAVGREVGVDQEVSAGVVFAGAPRDPTESKRPGLPEAQPGVEQAQHEDVQLVPDLPRGLDEGVDLLGSFYGTDFPPAHCLRAPPLRALLGLKRFAEGAHRVVVIRDEFQRPRVGEHAGQVVQRVAPRFRGTPARLDPPTPPLAHVALGDLVEALRPEALEQPRLRRRLQRAHALSTRRVGQVRRVLFQVTGRELRKGRHLAHEVRQLSHSTSGLVEVADRSGDVPVVSLRRESVPAPRDDALVVDDATSRDEVPVLLAPRLRFHQPTPEPSCSSYLSRARATSCRTRSSNSGMR